MTVASRSIPAGAPAPAVVRCSHCALPVPRGLVEDGAEQQFCCDGCRTVFSIIHTGGLGSYYTMRRELERDQAPARTSDQTYDEFDDPAYAAQHVRGAAGGLLETTLLLEAVHCAACVWLVERIGKLVPGVIDARLSLRRASVTVRWDPARTSLSAIARGLDRLGYPAHPPKGAEADAARKADDRRFLIHVAVAGAIAGNVMLVAVAMYAGLFEGINASHQTLFRWVSMVLGVVSLAWPGRVFFRGAIGALRARAAHLDLPIALALAVGGTWGVVNTIRGAGEVYFDSLTVLVFLLLVGRWIQRAQQRRAAESVDLLFRLTPRRARLITETGARTVSADTLSPDDEIEVRPGETFPADGNVLSGDSDADTSLITGESRPVPIAPGDPVAAGAINLTAPLRVRVEAAGEDSRIGKLMRSVADASSRGTRSVAFADRIAGWFVIAVSAIALITGIGWAFVSPELGVEHATALLVVSCPCALGLATPLVFTVASGRLASRGVLIKSGTVLEALCRPGTLFVDKTGTLTHGVIRAVDLYGDPATLAGAAALERNINHPIATAIVNAATERGLEIPHATNVTTDRGVVTGKIGDETILVGPAMLIAEGRVSADGALTAWCDARAAEGLTPITIASKVNGQLRADTAIAMGDTARPESAGFIHKLRKAGWRIEMLSGDRDEVASAVAQELGGLDAVRGSIAPEGKLDLVREATREQADVRGAVVMLGDGVNDAAALAQADVGIAVAGGAEVSLEAASVYATRPGLAPVAELWDAARGATGRVRLCLVASLSYNAIAVVAAAAGFISPLLAAVLMPASSLTVLAIAASGAVSGRSKASEEGACRWP